MRTLILGGPGCGKTTRLLEIMDDALKRGVPPERIAFMSFSRAAANEARERAIAKFQLGKHQFPHVRTLHSMAYRDAGFTGDMVMTTENYRELGRLCTMDFKGVYDIDEDNMFYGTGDGDRIKFVEEQARIRNVPAEKLLLRHPEIDVFQFRKYKRALDIYKRENDLFDFTDMIQKYVLDGIPLDVDVFIVDEAQDLSHLQWQVAERAIQKAKDVYFAGDDDQCIHTWCGADLRSFRTLQFDHKEVLAKSWRMTKTILSKGQTVISPVLDRYEKEWFPRDEEGSVKLIDELQKIDYSEGTWLLLARNAEFLSRYEAAMTTMGWHYTRVGQKSPISKYVEPIYHWERLRRGDTLTVEQVKQVYALMETGHGVARGHKTMRGAIPEKRYGMRELMEHHGLLVQSQWDDALRKIPYQKKAYIFSCRENGEKLLQEPRIRIGTIHSVKGAEADNVVLMPDMSWPTFKSYKRGRGARDDEARVFFVGITRARHNLFITTPMGSNHYPL